MRDVEGSHEGGSGGRSSPFLLRVLIVAALGTLAWIAASPAGVEPVRAAFEGSRVVAVGDVHGDLDSLTTILRRVGLVDDSLDWAGGDSVLVQTGDVMDRGVEVGGVIELLRRLARQARQRGGRVVVLLGNHEAQNLIREFQAHHPDMYAAFADADSERRRQRAWERYRQLAGFLAQLPANDVVGFEPLARDAWLDARPPGSLEFAHAVGPDGELGIWLRSLPVTWRRGPVLFLHAGISPALREHGLDGIEARVDVDLERFDRARRVLLRSGWILEQFDLHEIVDAALLIREDPDGAAAALAGASGEHLPTSMPDEEGLEAIDELLRLTEWTTFTAEGPLWYRGFDPRETELDLPEYLAGLASDLGVERFVTAHSPSADGRIRMAADGRLFLIDTGMLRSVYGGGPAALEIGADGFIAVYPGHRERLCCGEAPPAAPPAESAPGPPELDPCDAGSSASLWRGPDGKPLPFRRPEEVEEFLAAAEIVHQEEIPVGVTRPVRVILEADGVRARAIFRDVDEEHERVRLGEGEYRMHLRDFHGFETAAYRASRLLGMRSVPPTARRRVGRREGSVQLWLEGTITEHERVELGLSPPDVQPWIHQIHEMRVFDYLVANDDRHARNILVERAGWRLWLVDHTRAFQRHWPGTEKVGRIAQCEADLWEAIAGLDSEEIRRGLEPYLDGREIDALLDRRDRLVEHLRRLIAERGRGAVICPSRARPALPPCPAAAASGAGQE